MNWSFRPSNEALFSGTREAIQRVRNSVKMAAKFYLASNATNVLPLRTFSPLKSFFAELRRRNVSKVAVAYAVAWLLIQAGSIILHASEAPTGHDPFDIRGSDAPTIPEFHRKLAEWGMTESWQRAEAWREKNLPNKAQ